MSETEVFGRLADGRPVHRFTLTNASGAQVQLTEWGASIASVLVPDRTGVMGEVTLGYPTLDGYVGQGASIGAVCGRYAGRIRHGRFSLDGVARQLATNAGSDTLHGGPEGFGRRLWKGEGLDGNRIRFSLESPDGDQGFPGTVSTSVVYRWDDLNQLTLTFDANSDAPTPFNITSHAYWNLGAALTVLDHTLAVAGHHITPLDETFLPDGGILDVSGSAIDVRAPARIGDVIATDHPQLVLARGIDQCWQIEGEGMRMACVLADPASGRVLTVSSDQPALQVYSGNWLESEPGRTPGTRLARHAGIALETQHFADSPNNPHFPDTILRPGRPFNSVTVFGFGVA